MIKKLTSILLLIAIMLSTAGNAFASDYAQDWQKEWEELQKNIGIRQSPLKTPEEVEYFRQLYWDHLLPSHTKDMPGRVPLHVPFNPRQYI